jgi:hypothetical protein
MLCDGCEVDCCCCCSHGWTTLLLLLLLLSLSLPLHGAAAAAERIGVFAEPELEFRHLGPHDAFLVIASDGVFEFLSSQRVVDMVRGARPPLLLLLLLPVVVVVLLLVVVLVVWSQWWWQ